MNASLCAHESPPRTKTGLCVLCKRERERVYYHSVNREKKLAYEKARWQTNPRDQSTPEHRAYMREWQRTDRKKDPEKYSAYERTKRERHGHKLKERHQIWSSKNRGYLNALNRARKAGLRGQIGITQAEWDAIVAKQKGRCADCGAKRKLTQDHIDPASKGGAHGPYNIRGLCGRCNSSKGNRIIPGTQMALVLRKVA